MRSSMRARRLLGATALAIVVLVAMAPVAAVAAPTVSAHDRKGPVVTPLAEFGSDDFVIGSTIGPDGALYVTDGVAGAAYEPGSGYADAVMTTRSLAKAAHELGTEVLGHIPIDVRLREGADAGKPLVVSDPDAPASRALLEVAAALPPLPRSLVGKRLTLLT